MHDNTRTNCQDRWQFLETWRERRPCENYVLSEVSDLNIQAVEEEDGAVKSKILMESIGGPMAAGT